MAGLSLEHKRDLHLIRWSICAVVVIILSVAGLFAYRWYTEGSRPPLVPLPATAYADSGINETPVSQHDIDDYTVPDTNPRYISIPALSVLKVRVATTGMTNGILNMPTRLDDAAWYDKSAFPGQGFGSVLIAGNAAGAHRNGPFVNLSKLKSGDKIVIERGDGKQFSYHVVKSATMSLKDVNATGMQELATPLDASREGLGMITYAGTWIPRDHIYTERVLVWATAQ